MMKTDVMCKDGSVIPGGEWPSVDWMTDTPSLGAATRDMSWFVGFCCALFPHVQATSDLQYPRKMFLNDSIKLRAKRVRTYPLSGESMSNTPCQVNEVLEVLQWASVTKWVVHMPSTPSLCTQQSIQQHRVKSAHIVIDHITVGTS